MEPAERIPTEVLSECIHFAQKKIGGFITSADKSRLIFKCLTKVDFSQEDLAFPIPGYADSRDFRNAGPVIFGGPIDWRSFRLLLFIHFAKFLRHNPALETHIFQRKDTVELCIALLETDGGVNWKLFIPKTIAGNRTTALKRIFQLCKHHPGLTPETNVKVQNLLSIMRRYTVEDPLELLTTVYPEFTTVVQVLERTAQGTRNPPCDKLYMGVVYHVLNAYINWYTFNRKQLVNSGLYMDTPKDPLELKYAHDLRCSNCWKLLTARSTQKNGNPKNVEIFYSTDTHALISSCCFARLVKLPLVVAGTIIAVNTPGGQCYHLCPCGCDKMIVSEVSDPPHKAPV
uniref:ORF44 n=1 Tax=Latid herpesvirus 1 TaxID=3096545 RepID=A0AB33V907_9VIRU